MKCPICREQIDDDAQKCSHCGSYVKLRKRAWGIVRSILELVTLIAAIVVLFLMWEANRIMQDSVEEARKSVDQGREALELTRASVSKIDTGFAMTREQIDIQQEQLNLQRKSAEELSREFIEEKRPRIDIIPTTTELTDTSLLVHVDFRNTGFADAEDLLLYAVLKYEDTPGDTLASDLTRIAKITKSRYLTEGYLASASRRVNLTLFVEARYTWTINDLNYKDSKYFRLPYDEQLGGYRIYLLDEDDIEKLWR